MRTSRRGIVAGVAVAGIAAVSNSNAWAVGSTGAKILMLHWNGKSWS
jgi:hypothetical protein